MIDLATMTRALIYSANGSNFGWNRRSPGQKHGRLVGLNQMQLFVGQQISNRGSIFTITTGPEHCEKDCFGTHLDIQNLCKEGRLKEALQRLDAMHCQSSHAYSDIYLCLLQGCINMKSLGDGKSVHAHIIKNGFKPNIYLGNALLNMYFKCGSVMDAQEVFNKMPEQDIVSWNVMIVGYSRYGYSGEVFRLFYKLQRENIMPNKVTFIGVLKACSLSGDLEQGKQAHANIIKYGCEADVFVGTTLIDMYAKCGSVLDARDVFDKMPKRSVVSWNVMIAGYARHGHGDEALEIYNKMLHEGLKPDKVTFFGILKACSSLAALEQGKHIHAHIINNKYEADIGVGSSLIDMYAKCGSVVDARQVFDKMTNRTLVSWNAMIAGYAQNGHVGDAFKLFWQMQQENMKPDKITFFGILKACSAIASLEQGKQVHSYIVKCGFESDSFVGSTLIAMYNKCGSVEDAYQVFEKLPERTVVSWNTMIAGYAQHGLSKEAFKLFQQMQLEGVKPDNLTFVGLLIACASLGVLEHGEQIHRLIIQSGCESDVLVKNTLVDMYAKCGSVVHARRVFDKMPQRTVVSWNAMITGYTQQGFGDEALQMFHQMQLKGVKPDKFTFSSVLKACTSLAALEKGKQIHVCIMESEYEADVFVGSALIDMYSKCRALGDAHQVFERMPKRNVVSWNAMIAGYAHNGHGEKALKIFWQMQHEGLKPDNVTFLGVLKACSSLGALEQGKHIHAQITKCGCGLEISVGNTLLDMYAKCGSMWDAQQVFDSMTKRSIVSWNALIAGYAQHGYSKRSLKIFCLMQQEGVRPDEVTFLAVLSACSHAGLVAEGCGYFNSMNKCYGIIPAEGHYICMVDLLGRAGHLEEAHNFIKQMPLDATAAVWMTLLGACRLHGNIELAKHAVDFILKLEPENASAFVLLSNVYAATGKWHDKAILRKMMEVKMY